MTFSYGKILAYFSVCFFVYGALFFIGFLGFISISNWLIINYINYLICTLLHYIIATLSIYLYPNLLLIYIRVIQIPPTDFGRNLKVFQYLLQTLRTESSREPILV